MHQNESEDLERKKFLADMEPGIRQCLRSKGHDDRLVDGIVALLAQRCRGMPAGFALDFSAEISSAARVAIVRQVSSLMHEVAGFFISALIDAELANAYSDGAEPKQRTTMQ
jgi:hypothetical protein